MKNDEELRLKDERDMTNQEWLDWKKELDEATISMTTQSKFTQSFGRTLR